MTIDTSHAIDVEIAPVNLIGIFAGSVVFVVIAGAIPFGFLVRDMETAMQAFAFGGVGVLALSAVFIIWHMAVRRSGAIVTVSPQGVHDRRIAAEIIPWRAIRAVTPWPEGRKIIVLSVDPALERTLTRPDAARGAATDAEAVSLYIVTSNLRIRHDVLLATLKAYWQAWSGAAPAARDAADR